MYLAGSHVHVPEQDVHWLSSNYDLSPRHIELPARAQTLNLPAEVFHTQQSSIVLRTTKDMRQTLG